MMVPIVMVVMLAIVMVVMLATVMLEHGWVLSDLPSSLSVGRSISPLDAIAEKPIFIFVILCFAPN